MRSVLVAAFLLAPLVALAQTPGLQTQDQLFDPVTGYRLVHYRGVIASAPEGVARIDTARAVKLWRDGATFIDVNPAPGAVRDPDTDRWSLPEPHPSIPGAHWFAESGRGRLTPDVEHRFLEGVQRLAAAHPRRTIVVFCRADCWMSWNAALRLHRAGIRNLVWFADGLDGWKEAGLPTKAVTPR